MVARDLYLQAIDDDPQFAPAWGRVARMHRLIAKYHGQDPDGNLARAEDALHKALRLNPDLSIAHHLFAQVDVDRGRADEALRRLIARARNRGDAQIYAALVHTCRVCGLMDASLAAHDRARQIDPAIDTGVMHTYWLLHRYEDALASSEVKAYVAPASLVELGRLDEARTLISELEARSGNRVPAMANAVRVRGRLLLLPCFRRGLVARPDAIASRVPIGTRRRPQTVATRVGALCRGWWSCPPRRRRSRVRTEVADRIELCSVAHDDDRGLAHQASEKT